MLQNKPFFVISATMSEKSEKLNVDSRDPSPAPQEDRIDVPTYTPWPANKIKEISAGGFRYLIETALRGRKKHEILIIDDDRVVESLRKQNSSSNPDELRKKVSMHARYLENMFEIICRTFHLNHVKVECWSEKICGRQIISNVRRQVYGAFHMHPEIIKEMPEHLAKEVIRQLCQVIFEDKDATEITNFVLNQKTLRSDIEVFLRSRMDIFGQVYAVMDDFVDFFVNELVVTLMQARFGRMLLSHTGDKNLGDTAQWLLEKFLGKTDQDLAGTVFQGEFSFEKEKKLRRCERERVPYDPEEKNYLPIVIDSNSLHVYFHSLKGVDAQSDSKERRGLRAYLRQNLIRPMILLIEADKIFIPNKNEEIDLLRDISRKLENASFDQNDVIQALNRYEKHIIVPLRRNGLKSLSDFL